MLRRTVFLPSLLAVNKTACRNLFDRGPPSSRWRRCAQAGLIGPGPGEVVILGLLAAVFGAGYSVCCMWRPLKPLPTPEAS